MSRFHDVLKLLSDPTRIRLLAILEEETLTVAELQEILDMGQSRISTHLGQLKQAGLVADRRDGKKSYYSNRDPEDPGLLDLKRAVLINSVEDTRFKEDKRNLQRVIERRRKASEAYFSEVAGKLGKKYCPGRSWEAIGHLLLRLTPHWKIADLGAGEGILSQLLAQRAEHVYCIDNAEKMVEVGSRLAREQGFQNLEYRLGDLESVPLADESVDLALLAQALHHARTPEKAIAEAHRILHPGGLIIILDLKEHTFEAARELYADQWLGFSSNRLYHWLRDAGFDNVSVETVSREKREPYFETILGLGEKAQP